MQVLNKRHLILVDLDSNLRMSALIKKPPKDLLLCVFVHGFKGDDDTFQDFPSRVEFLLQETVENVSVESIVFPRYETRGSLSTAVEAFVEWLDREVQQREVKRAIELEGEYGAAGTAKVVLCGHSMGGLLIADAITSIRQIYREGPLWPRIIAVLAFDTPYLGVHPNLYKDKVEDLHTIITAIGGLGFGAGASTSKPTSAPKPPTPKAITSSGSATPTGGGQATSWGTWAKIGGALLAAGGTAAAAYYHKDTITSSVSSGVTFLNDHMAYVGNLYDEKAMKDRLNSLVQVSKDHKIIFRAFYTYLPKQVKLGQTRPRTFIILPYSKTDPAPYFVPAGNARATDEIKAHMGMFNPKTNDGYYDLGSKTAQFIREAIQSLMETEKTMHVEETSQDLDEQEQMEQNRAKVAEDGREAQAAGGPTRPPAEGGLSDER